MSAVEVFPVPGSALMKLAVRQVVRGAVVVTAVSAGMSALVAGTYGSAVGDSLDASSFAALAANPAIRTLFGEPTALEDPGGFTVWRTGTVVAVLVGVWGLLATTRVTRGEEEAGRWDLLLAGRLSINAVVARQLAVLVGVMVAAGVAVSAALLATSTEPGGAMLHGAGVAAGGVFFVGVGGLAAQAFPTRSAASGAAVAVLGAALLARMVGDGVAAVSWLRWLSPFGLVELTRAYGANRWLPVAVLATVGMTLVATTPVVAGRRDLRGGWFTPMVGRKPRMALLGSMPLFAARRLLRPLAGWSAGIAAYFLLIGLIARSMTGFLAENPRFAELAAQAGFADLGSVRGYTGTLFALLAVPVGVFTAARMSVFTAEEAGGRLTALYAQPLTRRSVAGAEVVATAGGAMVLTVVAGAATWVGAGLAEADLSLLEALAGSVNVLPIALLCLGASVFALGLMPRAVALIGALPAVGGFLVQVVADSVDAPGWVAQVSPFAHLAMVPAESPAWHAAAGMVIISAALTAVGLWAFQRRDVRLS